MPTTVLAFSSTPRRRGNSDILVDQILAGAAAAGAIVEKVRLHGLTIGPCTACDACQVSVETPCVIADDATPLLAKVRHADVLVFGSPIYFGTVNGQMKMFLDRLYALFGGGTFDALRGRRLALAFAYASPDPFAAGTVNAIHMFQDAARELGIDLVGWVCACCQTAGEVEKNGPVLESARALGRKLVTAPAGAPR